MRYAAAVVLDLHTHIRHTSYGAHLSPSPTLLSFASCPLDPFWKKKVSNRRSKATVRTGCFFPLLSLSASNQKNALTASICLLFKHSLLPLLTLLVTPSSSSCPPPPPLVTSATGSMTSFRRWQPGVRKERQIPKHTDRGDGREEKERGREAGGREGGGQTDKSSSRGSVLARNVKQFSQASSLPS